MLCREKGTTILISSHILSEIEQLTDVIGVINNGKPIEEVSIDELHKQNRQYVEFVVSDKEITCLLLKQKFAITDYSIHENDSIRLYSTFEERANINAIFHFLYKYNVPFLAFLIFFPLKPLFLSSFCNTIIKKP